MRCRPRNDKEQSHCCLLARSTLHATLYSLAIRILQGCSVRQIILSDQERPTSFNCLFRLSVACLRLSLGTGKVKFGKAQADVLGPPACKCFCVPGLSNGIRLRFAPPACLPCSACCSSNRRTTTKQRNWLCGCEKGVCLDFFISSFGCRSWAVLCMDSDKIMGEHLTLIE
jgi:hypothetical protein